MESADADPVKRRVAVFSVVPSPYQRDLFAAIQARPEIDLQVFYLEAAAPDSPWPEKPLAAYEQILPGFWFSLGSARIHCNWGWPDLAAYDLIVLNSLMSLTAQVLMRGPLRQRPWVFLGEKLGARRAGWHQTLTNPLHRASAIAAIGHWAESDYHARFPQVPVFNLPYHCNIDGFFAIERKRVEGEVVFLFCGQMIARKGLDLLLDAFARLPRGRLLLAGREAELPKLLASMPTEVRTRIEYAGFIAPDELPGVFARAHVFVLPSRYDGWGVVVNQAVATGLPVICSDQVGAGYDLVEPSKNGIVFEAGNADALETAMRRFVEEPDLIGPWGEASRHLAQSFTPAKGAERWSAAIDTVLAQ